jgi:hypothetical protein
MITKQKYTVPKCELMFDMEAFVLCASTTLDPLVEDNDTIVWVE